MSCYRVLINGVNFLLEVDGVLGRHGFYTTRWVEAPDPEAAEATAIQLFRAEAGLRERLHNTADDRPALYVEQVEEAASLQSAQGLAFYPEEETVIPGTPPSPEDTYPSNVTTVHGSNYSRTFTNPLSSEAILDEYRAALAQHPHDAGLRLHFGIALQQSGDLDTAVREARRAVQLRPGWGFARSTLASLLAESGDAPAAETEYREALRLDAAEKGAELNQAEATLRWGLARVQQGQGQLAAGRAELERAVEIQRALVDARSGSPSLLVQLEQSLRELDGSHG